MYNYLYGKYDEKEYIEESTGRDKTLSSNSDQSLFEINNGELVKYHGDQAVVHVPDGVVCISEGAFTRPVAFLGYGGPPPMCSWGGMETSEINVGTHEELCGFEFIREVYLPASVETIAAHAFQNCVNLECIHLPSRLRSIGTHAFARCHRLKQIEVPKDTIIEYQAFFMSGTNVIRV
ncbi:MAG: leucine-rich repeat protein [Clostridia bacterium]|nr:leucine-rich repeat protein [Clostridia bacterium]